MVNNQYGIGVRIDGLDVAPVVIEGGKIEYGRSDRADQPAPTVCELTLFTKQGWPQNPNAWFEYGVGTGPWSTGASGFVPTHDTDDTYVGPLAGLYIGAPVWVAINTPSGFLPDHDTQDTYLGESFRRFTGLVQALDYSRERIHVTCVGDLEAWSRIGLSVLPTGWPVERDTERALRIAAEANAPTTLHTDGTPGLYVSKPIEGDFPASLYDYLVSMATETGALLYQDREGRVWWRSRNWVIVGDPYEIPPDIVDADSLDMALELGDVENWLLLFWRQVDDTDPADVIVDTPYVVVEDADSVARYGYRFQDGGYGTRIGDAGGANAAAMTMLDARAPRWEMPEATILLNMATDQQLRDIAALDLGSQVRIAPMPTGAPVPEVIAEILGYTEHLSQSDWALDLHLAPYIAPYPEQGPG